MTCQWQLDSRNRNMLRVDEIRKVRKLWNPSPTLLAWTLHVYFLIFLIPPTELVQLLYYHPYRISLVITQLAQFFLTLGPSGLPWYSYMDFIGQFYKHSMKVYPEVWIPWPMNDNIYISILILQHVFYENNELVGSGQTWSTPTVIIKAIGKVRTA